MTKMKHIATILCTACLLLLPGCRDQDGAREQVDANEQTPAELGIVAFEQTDDAYAKTNAWKYQWDVQLDADQGRNNTFELLKLTEIISVHGHADIHPDVAEQALVTQSVFDKYRFDGVKFRFRVGNDGPSDNHFDYGQQLSGWSCGISIGSMGSSLSMLFPGTGVANVKVNTEGGFADSDLEFMSFETTKDGVKYGHRAVLRKKTIGPNSIPSKVPREDEN